MNRELNRPTRSAPTGMVYIPTFPNGAPDLSRANMVETPFGRVLAVKIETHPFLDECFRRTIEIGLMNEDKQWLEDVPQGIIALWVKMYYSMIDSTPDWKYFEMLWNLKNLRTLVLKKNHKSYDHWKKELLKVFHLMH